MTGTQHTGSDSPRFKIEAAGIHMAFPFAGDQHGVEVLSGVSFGVAEGAFVSILGPSGCGKTTLVKVLAGLLRPVQGVVRVDGREIASPSPDRTVIFQEYGLFEWKTVRENVEFGLKAKGLPKHQRREVAQRFIELVHLHGSERKYPNELSGGMKQRAAIARALAVEPECVLMDEPFAALDSQTRQILQEDILEIWEKTRKTILLVTHNVEEAVFLSDRILMLSNIPTKVVLDIPVGLPRPRPPELRFESGFRKIADRLWHALRSEVGHGRPADKRGLKVPVSADEGAFT
ncbi:MAG: ABC transporter ATP-binding protein [Planctomycetota bacterium]|nr:ABC transporter ATP-binding protein [Planctomycetota bacterium]